MTLRLLYFVSHPIQYQAPLLRRIARQPGIELRVLFECDTSSGYFDAGFGQTLRWDVPLREGYDSELLGEVDMSLEIAAADAVWLHGWQSSQHRRALRAAHRAGKPVFMRGENTLAAMPDGPFPRSWAKRAYLRSIFARCDGFLTIGSDNADYYRHHGIPSNRLFPMPYAVDNLAFATAAARARPHREVFRRTLGLPEGLPIVLYCGKFVHRKHPEWLLEAWKRVQWPGKPPILLFVGGGEMEGDLRARATDGIAFLGFRNQGELPALYDLADVFVLPSEREPWGLAINEAMACGTPVIVSSEVGCARDLVDPSCGAVFSVGDTAALANALVDVLGRAETAGMAASEKIRSWDFESDVTGLLNALSRVSAAANPS